MADTQTTTVVIAEHDSKSGTGKKGAWTLHLFKASNGEKFQTFNQAIANRLYGFAFAGMPPTATGASVLLTFKVEANGDYENNVLEDVMLAAEGAAPAAAPATSAPTTGTTGSAGLTPEQRKKELRIMRQHAMTDAIASVSALGLTGMSFDGLTEISERFVRYYAGGPQTAAAATPPAASQGAVESAPVAQAPAEPAPAPVAAAPAPAPGPDDDIPF